MLKKKLSSSYKLLISLLICVGGGWLSGIVGNANIKEWYPHLIKPSITPPDAVFPLVWAVLYVLMAISLYLVWISRTKQKTAAMVLFFIQLGCNFLWSSLFFYAKNPMLAFFDITILWATLVLTMLFFYRISKTASLLLLPYLLWVSFASYLNIFIWIHN